MKSAIFFALLISCGTHLAWANSCGTGTAQNTQYCQAQSTATSGAQANSLVGHAWQAVSVVCFAACASPHGNMSQTCKQVSAGASALTGSTSSALSSNFASNNGTSGSTEGAATSNDQTSACAGGLQAFQQAKADYNDQNAQQNIAQKAQNSENQLNAPTAPGLDGSGTSSAATAGSGLQSAISQCSQAQTGGNVSMAMNCAAQMDPNLPSSVTSPGFAQDFQNASGTPLSNFLNNSDSPDQAIAGALGGGGASSDQVSQIETAMASVDKNSPDIKSAASAMVASGGKKSKNEGVDELDLTGILSGLGMNKKIDGASPIGVGSLSFGRSPASVSSNGIAEDRTISLFVRVSQRYSQFAPKILGVLK